MKHYIIITTLFIASFLSCVNKNKSPETVVRTDSIKTLQDAGLQNDQNIKPEKPPKGYEYSYKFINSSISQILYIKTGPLNKKLEVPENLKFKLIFQDQTGQKPELKMSGTAILFSSTESFSENNHNGGGDYDASQYNFKTKDASLSIQIDVENYAAANVSFYCSDTIKFKRDYELYFTEENNRTHVLKRAN